MADQQRPVTVSRRIEAPASRIFAVLADPGSHVEFDGSEMLRGAVDSDAITAVGDTFSMRMYLDALGDYVMLNHVVEYEPDRRIAWEPSPGDPVATQGGSFPLGVAPGHRWGFDLAHDGPNATIVTETYECAAAPAEVRAAVNNGEMWIEAMSASLGRLDALCTRPSDT